MSSTNITLFLFSKPVACWSGKTWRGKPSSNTSSLGACHITLHSDHHSTSKPRTAYILCLYLVAVHSPHGLPYQLMVYLLNEPIKLHSVTNTTQMNSKRTVRWTVRQTTHHLGLPWAAHLTKSSLKSSWRKSWIRQWWQMVVIYGNTKRVSIWLWDKIGDNLWPFFIARAQAASSAEQNDAFMSTKGTPISSPTKVPGSEVGTNKAGDLPNKRFSISIRGPDSQSFDFRLKKTHTVHKVLLSATHKSHCI